MGLIMRVAAYIDGFNLYYGLRDKGWKCHYWLDMPRLIKLLLKPGQQLTACHYFTARISGNDHGHQDQKRQSIWLDAIYAHGGVEIHYGKYLVKRRQCRQCNHVFRQPEEKMTDVNIATKLLVDAFQDNFDTAIVVSGDSDLVPPIMAIRKHLPDKRIIVAFPPERFSNHLRRVAHGTIHIGREKLKRAHMPDEIVTDGGYVLRRPDNWK